MTNISTPRESQRPTFATLFSGCGGFDIGFYEAGFEGVGAFDNDPIAVKTYNENQRGEATLVDLSESSVSFSAKPQVVLAGPPCQGFSTLGKRNLADPRNSLLTTAARLAVQLAPQVIAIENVTGVLSGALVSHFVKAQETLHNAGYETQVFRLAARDFGLPQIRRRVVLLGSKQSIVMVHAPSDSQTRTLRDVLSTASGVNHEPVQLKKGTDEFRIARQIGQNQKLCNVRGGNRAVPTWQIPEVFGKVTQRETEVLELIRRLRRQIRCRSHGDADPVEVQEIDDRLSWNPKPALAKLHRKGYLRCVDGRYDFTHTFNGKYRRLSSEHEAPAVDTRFGQPRYFIHPEEDRGLSVREAARIQGFPDQFTFLGSRQQQFRLVGNAVPPPIGFWLASQIKEKLL